MGGERSEPTAPVMDYTFASGELTLSGHLAQPQGTTQRPPGLVLCHGFPTRGRESPQSGISFPELADRVAAELGFVVLTMNFRGCGKAEGDFSLQGWLDDVGAAVAHMHKMCGDGVWLAGYGSGASLAVVEGARNPRVRGVAAMATPRDFDDWAKHPRRLLLHARQVQVIKDPSYPADFDRWSGELKSVRPLRAAAELAPRPLLVIHGDSDDLTPMEDGLAIAEAHGNAEIRILSGAGHELRHDPRAVAVLLGWLRRQRIAAESAAAAGPVTSVGSVEVTGSDLPAESVAVAEPAEPADSPGSAAPAGGAGSPGSPTSADSAPGESQGPTNAGQDTSSATTDETKEP